MSTIIALIILITVSNAISLMWNKKKSIGLQVCCFTIIVVLYLFYIVSLLEYGRVTLLLIGLILIISTIRKYGWRRYLHHFIDSSCFTCLFLLTIFVYFFTLENRVELWDEMRLWAAVPKAMHRTGQLQLGSDAYIFDIMQSYPPGISLFQYFTMSFSESFNENELFVSYAVLYFVILSSLFDYQTKLSTLWRILFGTVGVLILPCIITSHGGDIGYYYITLFIDPLLGFFAGYLFYTVCEREKDTIYRIRLFLSISVITLLKDSGTLFALMTLLAYGIITKRKKIMLTLLFSFVPVAIWRLLLHGYGVINHISQNYYFPLPITIIDKYVKRIAELPAIRFEKIVGLNFNISIFASFIILFFVAILLCRISQRNDAIKIFILMCITSLIYIYGYLCLFGETKSLSSLQRYTTTIVAMIVSFALLQISDSCQKNKKIEIQRNSVGIMIAKGIIIGVGIFACITCFSRWNILKDDSPDKHAQAARIKNQIVEEIARNKEKQLDVKKPIKVYLIVKGEYNVEILHHMIALELIGEGIKVQNMYYDASILSKDEKMTKKEMKPISSKFVSRVLNSGADYIYLIEKDEISTSVFVELGVTAKCNCLYAIDEFYEKQSY